MFHANQLSTFFGGPKPVKTVALDDKKPRLYFLFEVMGCAMSHAGMFRLTRVGYKSLSAMFVMLEKRPVSCSVPPGQRTGF